MGPCHHVKADPQGPNHHGTAYPQGPCHQGTAHPQVVDGGTASNIERSGKYIE
jgi:hypothetical protein